MKRVPAGRDPSQPAFWFIMSMVLLFGAICAYPMNWWLVAHHLKHGMMTVRAAAPDAGGHAGMAHSASMPGMAMPEGGGAMAGIGHSVEPARIVWATIVSIVVLALGLVIAAVFGRPAA